LDFCTYEKQRIVLTHIGNKKGGISVTSLQFLKGHDTTNAHLLDRGQEEITLKGVLSSSQNLRNASFTQLPQHLRWALTTFYLL
jgi:hypothetical protein